MDNLFSRPTIKIPAVPSDAESKAGTSKSDLIRFIFKLLKGSTVEGITPSEPTPHDLGAIVTNVQQLRADYDKLLAAKVRHQILDAVSNGQMVVAFQDIGTTNYQVSVAYVTPNIDWQPISWGIIADSKKTNQVGIRLDGHSGKFQIEVTIRELKGAE